MTTMTIQAIFAECSVPTWLDVAENLQKNHSWSMCYWTAKPEFNSLVKKRFPQTIFHANVDAICGIPAEECKDLPLPTLDQSLLHQLAYCESISLRMMNRMDRNDCFSYEERSRLFYKHVQYWLGVLEKFSPDIVFFPVAPHLVYGYILYTLCKLKGIATIMFELTSIVPFIFPVRHFEEGSKAILSTYEHLKKKKPSRVTLSQETEHYLKRMAGDSTQATPFYMKSNLAKQRIGRYLTGQLIHPPKHIPQAVQKAHYLFSRRHYIKQRGRSIEQSEMSGLRYLFCKFEGIQKNGRLQRRYEQYVEPVDLSQPYVYVPLHYQPERTTSPEGEVFAHQFLMVDMLSKCIPKGWYVYVREHPMQFKAVGSHGECSRIPEFYDDLIKLRNVKFLPFSLSSFDLIEHARAVATVTGTVGWEALLRKKPVLTFGHAWYKHCEGAFYTIDERQCRQALTHIAKGYIIDEKAVRYFLSALEQHAIKSYTEPAYQKVATITPEENVEHLTNCLASFYTQTLAKK